MSDAFRLGVLGSGKGSNFIALADAAIVKLTEQFEGPLGEEEARRRLDAWWSARSSP